MLKASSRNFAAIAAWTDYLINDHQVATAPLLHALPLDPSSTRLSGTSHVSTIP
jgi:hypothetical protein